MISLDHHNHRFSLDLAEHKPVVLTANNPYRFIPGFPGYLISDRGVVFSLRAMSVMKPQKRPNRYSTLRITKEDGRPTTVSVGRLVLLAFVGPPPGDAEDYEAMHGPSGFDCHAPRNLMWIKKGTRAEHRRGWAWTRAHDKQFSRMWKLSKKIQKEKESKIVQHLPHEDTDGPVAMEGMFRKVEIDGRTYWELEEQEDQEVEVYCPSPDAGDHSDHGMY